MTTTRTTLTPSDYDGNGFYIGELPAQPGSVEEQMQNPMGMDSGSGSPMNNQKFQDAQS